LPVPLVSWFRRSEKSGFTTKTPTDPSAANRSSASRRIRGLLIGLATIAVSVLIWEQVLKDRLVAKRWGVVVPGVIYRSGQISKWMIEESLTRHGIRSVIDLNGRDPDDAPHHTPEHEHQTRELEVVRNLGIKHDRFALGGDGRGDIRYYADAIEVLVECRRAGKPVLIHCASGTQRTGGVVACYRLLVEQDSPQNAYAELRKYGWRPHANNVLLSYVNSHMAELAGLLVEKDIIQEVPNPLPVLGP